MGYDGPDRRYDSIEIRERLARIEEKVIHIDKRINGSIEDIEKHMERGTRWRVAITGIAVSLMVSIASAIYAYGRMSARVDYNTQEIERIRLK